MRQRRAITALALTTLLLAPTAAAEQQVSLLDLIGPGLGFLDGQLVDLGDLLAPTPFAPIAAPAIELGRLLVEALRLFAQATVIGAKDGDAGSVVGTPESAGVVTEERILVDGVAVPGQEVSIQGQTIPVGTPGVNRTIVTPPIGVPSYRVTTPPIAVDVTVPPLGVPPVSVYVPGLTVSTPPVGTPAVQLRTPPIGLEAQEVVVDITGGDVTVQELHGTIHLGPAGSVPYSIGPTTVGQSLLPEDVPRQATAATPPVEVLPATTLVDEPARTLVEAQRVEVLEPQVVHLTEGQPLFPGQHVTRVSVPSQTIATPSVAPIPSQRVPVVVPGQHVTTLEVPGQTLSTPTIVVSEEQVVLPGVDQQQPLGLGDLGYVGYGLQDDSSLYPYACTAVVGCMHSRQVLRPYVEYADAALDAAARLVDGDVIVRG